MTQTTTKSVSFLGLLDAQAAAVARHLSDVYPTARLPINNDRAMDMHYLAHHRGLVRIDKHAVWRLTAAGRAWVADVAVIEREGGR